jgi:ubiquinone/menaquinone biosynthesis C-methylase UbiE
MFSLTPSDLDLKILDCAGGTASFNAEMTGQGKNVTSCDPDYQLTAEQINAGLLNFDTFIKNFEDNFGSYRWKKFFTSPSQLAEVRRNATQEFLEDFPSGLQEGRYVNASLPDLPFNDDQFDLALCSHFLFTYRHSSENFPLEAIREMCRVAKEVRVFPLLDRHGGASEHLNPIVTELRNKSFRVEIQEVDYEFQPGGNQMLRVSKESSA